MFGWLGGLLAAVGAAIAASWFSHWELLPLAIVLLIPAGSFALSRRSRAARRASNAYRLVLYYEQGLRRVTDDWHGTGADGLAWSRKDSLYESDLNVLGPGSLFERLCVLRTAAGQEQLAQFLLTDPTSLAVCQARQSAVQELAPRLEERELLHLLGEAHQDCQADLLRNWVESEGVVFTPLERWLALLATSATVLTLLGLALGWLPWQQWQVWAPPVGAFLAAIGGLVRERVTAELEGSHVVAAHLRVLRNALTLLESRSFECPALRQLVDECRGFASGALRPIDWWLVVVEQRGKEWFHLLGLLLFAGTHSAMALSQWRREHRERLLAVLDAWGQYEALSALSAYAYESPNSIAPRFESGAPLLEAEGLGHPLLPFDVCVRNSLALGAGHPKLVVISGSNMAGKSTLLRSVGVNFLLARAGAPVRATHFRTSLFSLVGSISVQDSLLEGKSRFLAEVSRLKAALEQARAGLPVLLLCDEVLSGTNSSDRRVAVESVLRELHSLGALVLLSTHDLALTEIANLPALQGANHHMASRPGGDPLDFDYLLKPGVTTETNALAIARLAGVKLEC